MSERIPQSVAKRVVFRAYLASDGQTPATGKTIAITISKNGGAFGNPAAGATNATAISSGFYYFDLGTSDTGTLGPLAWRGAEGTIDDAGDVYEVVVVSEVSVPTAAENADALLGRNIAGGSSSGRTVKEALYFLRNKWIASGGTLTVYGTDDTTAAWTAALTQSAGDPVSASDPA